jgi:hypothetical protein
MAMSMRTTRLLFIAVIILITNDSVLYAGSGEILTSTFNPQWLDTVISIEVSAKGMEPTPIGTGFLVNTKRKHVLVVTAKHVVEEPLSDNNIRIGYRLNTKGTGSIIVWEDDLQKKGYGTWEFSKNSDLACRFVGWPKTAQIVTMSEENFINTEQLNAGTPVLVLGFPLGLRSTEHTLPIARYGIVGRTDPNGIIADIFVFPGNSGGPVVYNPSLKLGPIIRTKIISEEKLIGTVSSFIPYREPAISPQTKRVRVIFEENSGLANLVPVDRLRELLNSDAVLKIDSSIQ